IKPGKVTYGYLGITPQPVDEKMAAALDLPSTKGALVEEVVPNTPASSAGLEASDVIVKIDGNEIRDDNHLRKVVGTMRPGTKTTMEIYRDGKLKSIEVTLGDYPEELTASRQSTQKDNYNKLGIEVADLTPNLAERYKIKGDDEGVLIVDIDRSSDAYQEGLRVGDVILSVNKNRIESVANFNRIIAKLETGETILMRCKRDSRRFFSAIKIK
ncbi:MAG: PDZ domain-containing protein, partial [Calditrichaeota bacterium]